VELSPGEPGTSGGGSGSGYGERTRVDMPLGEYAAAWRADTPGLGYLKDWHLPRLLGPTAAAKIYSPPAVFGFDGLNAWCAPSLLVCLSNK